MFNYLRLSYNLLRLANSVLDRQKEKFKKELEGLDLNERELNEALDCLIGIKDHLVRKMCIHWLKKKSIVLPEDLPKVEKAKGLVKGNRGVDYLTFDSPVEIIDKYTKIEGIKKTEYIDPDSLPELYNKVDLGEGVTIYTVEDSKAGQYAVRRLADSHFGPKFDKWCITGRYPDLFPDKERDDMGMILEAFNNWKNTYNAYPKRVAFKDGKFFAFCGSGRKEIVWWDQGNQGFTHIPKFKHLGDDDDFINEHIVKELVKEWKSGYSNNAELAANRYTPIDILSELSNDKNYNVRTVIAGNPNTPVEVLVKLSNDRNYNVRESIAKNPNTPVEVLVKLSEDEEYRVRASIAENSNMSVEILVKLSSDEDRFIRSCVAENPNTPVEVLIELSDDDYAFVHGSVAKNPKTPVEILAKLSNDRNYWVRETIAKNPNTPVDILVKLSEDENEDVRNAAIKSLRK